MITLLATIALLKAFEIDFPWFTPFLVLSIVAIFIMFPMTPGVVGQYHIAIISSLLISIPTINVDKTKAVALIAHIHTLLPIAALGLFSILREKNKLFKVHEQSTP